MMRTICYQIQEVSDQEAKRQMKEFLQERKKNGVTSFTVLDFYVALSLPPRQINRVMDQFEKEGIVRESAE